jgi:hypothetical protein
MRMSKDALALSLLVPFHVMHAQAPPPVQPGERVRVTVPMVAYDLKGRWVEARPDTVRIRVDSDGALLEVPQSSVARLEVWRGRRSNFLPAAFIGLLVGGGVAVAAVTTGCSPNVDCFGLANAVVVPPVVGLVLGGTIGALVKSDRWERVSLDGNTSLAFAPLRDGRVGLGVSVSF